MSSYSFSNAVVFQVAAKSVNKIVVEFKGSLFCGFGCYPHMFFFFDISKEEFPSR